MSIHLPNAVWFSNQFLGTSKEVRGEGIDEVGVSCLGVFEVSPFSNFVDKRVHWWAFWELESERMKEMVHKKIRNVWEWMGKDGSQFIKRDEVQCICTSMKLWFDN